MPAPPTQPIRPSTTTHLAVVDVAEPARGSSASRLLAPERSARRARLRRAHHADLDAAGHQSLVVGARAALGIGALPVDDEPHRDALRRLGDQRLGEGVADAAPAGSRTG